MPSDESQPVDDGEYVLRRIHRNHFQTEPPCVLASAFRPTDRDDTGISVFREKFLTEPAEVLASLAPAKRNKYYVVRLAVSELRRLGLDVVPDPDPNGPRGHALIPSLSCDGYAADKQRLKEVQARLATLASNGIVHEPS